MALKKLVDLEFTNTGTGIARGVTSLLIPLVSRGSGIVLVVSGQPIVAGDLAPGESRIVRVVLKVPATVRQVELVEAGGAAGD